MLDSGLGMRLQAHYVGDEVEGDYEEQDEENWGCRTSGVGFHHHIWVAEGGRGNTDYKYACSERDYLQSRAVLHFHENTAGLTWQL